ncbi:MAG: indole-3-glycerol phosphate synthase TrpC [Myxococcaceae bacterium]
MTWRPPQGVLAELVAHAREDCAARKRLRPSLSEEVRRNKPATRGFEKALGAKRDTFPLICEVKRASPSAGDIRAGVDAATVAQRYVAGGARCISVLTEGRRFGGSLADLRAVHAAVSVPLLRKDFIVDPYMVAEAAEAGADAVLLIAGALPPSALAELHACAGELGLDALVEFIHPHELASGLAVDPTLVGINARDLETLEVDPHRFERLAPQLIAPGRLLVAESGVASPDDVRRLAALGAQAALVGESLMRADDPKRLVEQLARAMS